VRKTLIAGVIAAACATVAVTPAQAQAQADDPWYRCPSGYVCLFQYDDGKGLISPGYGPNNANVGSWFNDRTSSIWNRTTSNVCFYQDSNFGNYMFTIGAGHWESELPSVFNDKVTSYRSC
jgi:hypothetical protein